MTNTPLRCGLEGNAFRITLDHQPNRNALSLAMLEALNDALDEAQNTRAAAIVISAEGNVFCPGHDLKEMTKAREREDGGKDFFAKTMTLCADVMQKIVRHRLPVIAQVEGIATAAGCQLVASCDLAVASDTSKFATPGVNIGLFCSTPMVALSRNISRKHAMEMLLMGEPITARRARQIGLINRVLPKEEVCSEVDRFVQIIASKSSRILKIGKTAFYEQAEMDLTEAYKHCASVMVENMMEADAREGISAFVEKRDPKWTDE